MQKSKVIPVILLAILSLHQTPNVFAQQAMETGGKKMPDEWIDKDTQHKVIRLSRKEGSNASFYFHNDPFYGNKMVFYSTDKNGKQIYTVDLKNFAIDQITHQSSPMSGELVGQKTGNVYYQIKDSVFSTNINTKQTKLLFVFPAKIGRAS